MYRYFHKIKQTFQYKNAYVFQTNSAFRTYIIYCIVLFKQCALGL